MKVYIVYHKKCNDGFGSAYAAWKKLGNNAEYHAWNHHDPLPAFEEESIIYFCDIAPKRDVLLKLKETHSVRVIDHHKGAMEDLEGVEGCIFDMEHSGAILTWKAFHGTKKPPQFLKYIELMDLRKFDEKSRPICEAIYTYKHDFLIWEEELERKFNPNKLTMMGLTIKQAHDMQIDFALGSVVKLDICGYVVPAINVKDNISELGDILCRKYNTPFSALYSLSARGDYQFSLRSLGAMDVSDIAKMFGGAGHAKSSGFAIPFNNLVKDTSLFSGFWFTNRKVLLITNEKTAFSTVQPAGLLDE